MSASISSSTGRPYGIRRVCEAWCVPRSTFYRRRRQAGDAPQLHEKRGPKPKVTDDALLQAIRTDLATTPFVGEGHRKVWARLRVRDGIRASRKRVLRLMRENSLLSPHRSRPGHKRVHDGKIITDGPDEMWGTDGTRVFTVSDGWVWIFAAVEHWSAECVGWHVCKEGTRFAALEPISQGLKEHFGSVLGDVARGLSLRMDHGSQYLSDHFINQIKYWGIRPSYAFIEQPQTNGVAERFNRTLKEQAIHGHIFQGVEDLREAVGEFVTLYNDKWLIEKIGFRTPNQARAEHGLSMAA